MYHNNHHKRDIEPPSAAVGTQLNTIITNQSGRQLYVSTGAQPLRTPHPNGRTGTYSHNASTTINRNIHHNQQQPQPPAQHYPIIISNETRPTFGAYNNNNHNPIAAAKNAQPRGPYLQYKHNDHHQQTQPRRESPAAHEARVQRPGDHLQAAPLYKSASAIHIAPTQRHHDQQQYDNNQTNPMRGQQHQPTFNANPNQRHPAAHTHNGWSADNGIQTLGRRQRYKLPPNNEFSTLPHGQPHRTSVQTSLLMHQTAALSIEPHQRAQPPPPPPPTFLSNGNQTSASHHHTTPAGSTQHPRPQPLHHPLPRLEIRRQHQPAAAPTAGRPYPMALSASSPSLFHPLVMATLPRSGAQSTAHQTTHFLHQIQTKNRAMVANYNDLTRSATSASVGVVRSNIPGHCVTLEQVGWRRRRSAPGRQMLDHAEGWALLCQSVQALQDLFLGDTPSTGRILPLVRPSSLQITARGRVVFQLFPTPAAAAAAASAKSNSNADSKTEQAPAISDADMMSFLSPEFRANTNQKTSFSESDIEKMWIYSLGITLQRTIASTSGHSNMPTGTPSTTTNAPATGKPAIGGAHVHRVRRDDTPASTFHADKRNGTTASHQGSITNTTTRMAPAPSASLPPAAAHDPTTTHRRPPIHHNQSNNGPEHRQRDDAAAAATSGVADHNAMMTSLDAVIREMCAVQLSRRASLMNLLNVISEFCQSHHQVKPFSHIIMDLYKEVSESINETPRATPVHSQSTRNSTAEESKSDTDSGRSSAPGDPYSISNDAEPSAPAPPMRPQPIYATSLKVIRRNAAAAAQMESNLAPVIGGQSTGQAPVHLRKRKDEILRKKQNMVRRNTIAVNGINLVDVGYETVGSARSSNGLDRVGVPDALSESLNGASMPDLNAIKFATLPNLRVRRRQRIVSTEALDSSLDTLNSDSMSNGHCTGPEFITKSSLPAKELDITDGKCPPDQRRTVSILLLNGRSIKIACNSLTTTAQQVFESVIRSEGYEENFFLGLCALIGGDFVFLPGDLKIYKVAPQIWFNAYKKPNFAENVIFTLFLRIKFFLPTLRGISSQKSRHLLYLQLRKSILENQIICDDDDLIQLGGLALQTEIGNFQSSMKSCEYFTISHYLPEGVYQRNTEMARHLRNAHFTKYALPAKEAEHTFVKHVQELKEYGLHLYSAVWNSDDVECLDVYVSISLCGIALFERSARVCSERQHVASGANAKVEYQRKLYAQFDWLEIENLCFSKHTLCVVVRKPESLKAKDNNRVKYKLKMDGRKSYFAFTLASEHHKLYMKLRNSFTSLKNLVQDMNFPLGSTSTAPTGTAPVEFCPGTYERTSSKCLVIDEVPPCDEVNHPTKKTTLTKSTSTRVKNLKKSMLNDNRLLKLRDKFLKRSKSTVGISTKNTKTDHTLEESQNKENECPAMVDAPLPATPVVVTQTIGSPTPSVENDTKRVMSPNRSRVKMGTRAFVTNRCPSRSCDNIYDTVQNVLGTADNSIESGSDEMNGLQKQHRNQSLYSDIETSDDALSLKSTSLSSLYSSEKASEKMYSDYGVGTGDAYVIHSSIRSTSCGPAYFPGQPGIDDETVSESLFERINDLTNGSNQTLGTDRIINRITITKDRVPSSRSRKLKVRRRSKGDCNGGRTLFTSRSQESVFGGHDRLTVREDADEDTAWTLGISIVQGTDNNVYVKELVADGPGALAGINVGDQIIAVDGISLLSLPYAESLRILQESSRTVELVLSQIYRSNRQATRPIMVSNTPRDPDVDYLKRIRYQTDEASLAAQRNEVKPFIRHTSSGKLESQHGLVSTKSMPDLPKFLSRYTTPPVVVDTNDHHSGHASTTSINSSGTALPRSMGLSRRYVGPVKYPVTPMRTTLGAVKQPRLSLLADEDDEQVFI